MYVRIRYFIMMRVLLFSIFLKGMTGILEEVYNEKCSDVLTYASCPNSGIGKKEFRTSDGTCNNLKNNILGAANTKFTRLLPPVYYDEDGKDTPLGHPRVLEPKAPSPNVVSLEIIRSNKGILVEKSTGHLSLLHMTFGQFLDHDVTLQLENKKEECDPPTCEPGSLEDYKPPCFPIPAPAGANFSCTRFVRTIPVCRTPGEDQHREQINTLTAYVDASQVYSVNLEVQNRLRYRDGSGKLDMTDGLMALDLESSDDCQTRGGCFLGGDVRANEHVALASMHTLFQREHNRVVDNLKSVNPHWEGDRLFQEARRIVGAIFQKIVFYEFLPTIVDLSPYEGYDENVDPSIAVAFATAAFRYGHTQIPNKFSLLNKDYERIAPDLTLQEMFFNNDAIFTYGIEPILLGLIGNLSEIVDKDFAHDIVRKLFVDPMENGHMDLSAINIQRGRDHGLPGYGHWREHFGLGGVMDFDSVQNEILDGDVRDKLHELYDGRLDLIDLYVAGLLEEHLPGKPLGFTFSRIIKDQFERIRNGDRFYFENPDNQVFTISQRSQIMKTSFARVLCDNLEDIETIQQHVFHRPTDLVKRIPCSRILGIDFDMWKENCKTEL